MNDVRESMVEFPVLLERHLVVKRIGGAEAREIAIQIGQPYWTEESVEAACPVAIQGLLGRVQDIRGIDFIDAISLAIKFVDATLSGMRTSHDFFWPDGEAYFET